MRVIALIENNTCYDYGKGSGGPQPEGINCGNSCGNKATIRNNFIYAPAGTNPLSSGENNPANSNNLCGSGESCGTSSRVWSSSTVLSTDQNTSNFMRIGPTSAAVNAGATLMTVTIDYAGNSRPPYDIGAFAVGTGTPSALPPPSNLRITP